MAEFNYKINDFEGPLDLLLHLVARHRMDLFDIRIYELIDQYLDYIGRVDPSTLEPASEFVEMAARLVHMKSAALLPRTEETEQMERELTGQLIEYSLCKLAAAKLRDRSEGVNFFVRETLKIKLPTDYERRHDAGELAKALLAVKGRTAAAPDTSPFEPLVSTPIVSVESRVVHIMGRLSFGKKVRLRDFFTEASGRSERVATFLGVLELVRGGDIYIDGEGMVSSLKRGNVEA